MLPLVVRSFEVRFFLYVPPTALEMEIAVEGFFMFSVPPLGFALRNSNITRQGLN